MRNVLLLALLLANILQTNAQTLKGTLTEHKGQTITITGFNYYKAIDVDKTVADSLGNFSLNFPKNYKGMGILKPQDNSSLVLVLKKSKTQITGTHLKDAASLQFINSIENNQFVKYAKAYTQGKQAYSAWRYLKPIYTNLQTLNTQKKVLQTIDKELERLKQVTTNAIKLVPENSYLHWSLPMQTLVKDMPETIHKYTENLPKNIQQFRNIDFNHPNFKTSGLFKELIEGHYFLLENMGQSLDSVAIQMNLSTDHLIDNLKQNKPLLNTVSKAHFTYFEKRNLLTAASYLSAVLIKQHPDVLEDVLRNKMERYVTLKVGNIAPDIQLTTTKKLSNIGNNILLVFGTSECGHCIDDKKKLENYYPKWQEKDNIEVVYISLDTDKTLYSKAYGNTPWQTYCNFKGWDTQATKEYYINATPPYFLLDKNLKISS
jgi:thiol-disulfide isomerase/thioredoxin